MVCVCVVAEQYTNVKKKKSNSKWPSYFFQKVKERILTLQFKRKQPHF